MLPGLVGAQGQCQPQQCPCSLRPAGQGHADQELAKPLSSSCDGHSRRAKDYACAWVWWMNNSIEGPAADSRAGAVVRLEKSWSGSSQGVTPAWFCTGAGGQRGPAHAPSVPVPTHGLLAHANFFFPFWEIQMILLFLASSQPLTDITEIRARNMFSPFPSCHPGPAALPAAHLSTAAGTQELGRIWNTATCWSSKSTPANRATCCFSLDFNSC